MAIIEQTSADVASAEEVRGALKHHLGQEVIEWNARNVDCFEMGTKRPLGGYLRIIATAYDPQAERMVQRFVEVNDEQRPLPETVINAAGQVALGQPKIISDLRTA